MKNIKLDKSIISEIIELKENENSSKNEIKNYLMNKLFSIDSNDSDIFKKIELYIKESKLKFSRESNNWNSMIEFFRDSESLNKSDLKDHLMNRGMNEIQSKKYISSYYNYSIELYKLILDQKKLDSIDNSDYK